MGFKSILTKNTVKTPARFAKIRKGKKGARHSYSALNVSAGLVLAARKACPATVAAAIGRPAKPAPTKIHALREPR